MDAILSQLCQNRAGLPPILPGRPTPERLEYGAKVAGEALRRYTKKLTSFTMQKAWAAEQKVQQWEDSNRYELQAVMSDRSVSALPDAIALHLGSDVAQDFILAGYYQAVIGAAPHLTNMVNNAINSGTTINGRIITDTMMQQDVDNRIQMFASILKMEEEGELARIFTPPQGGVNGMGVVFLAPLIWPIVVTLLGIAACITVYKITTAQVREANETMRGLCEKAQQEGDKETVKQCLDASAKLAETGGFAWTPVLIGVGIARTLFGAWKLGLFEKKKA